MPKSFFKLFFILFLCLFALLFLQPKEAFARVELNLDSGAFIQPVPPYRIPINNTIDVSARGQCEEGNAIQLLVTSSNDPNSQPIVGGISGGPPLLGINLFGIFDQRTGAVPSTLRTTGTYYYYAKCLININQNRYSDRFSDTDIKVVEVIDPNQPIVAVINPPANPALGSKFCNPVTGNDAGAGAGGISTAIGCIPTEPSSFVAGLIKFASSIGGGIALLLMISGAFQMITSSGNPDSLKKGQQQFNSAIIGLLFIIFAVLFLQVVGVDILNIPGFGR